MNALGIEGIEGFDEEIFGRYIAGTDGKAANAVEIAVRQAFRAVAAEEGAVLEVFVVGKGVPTARYVRITAADVEAHRPEVRRSALIPAEKGKVCCAPLMIVPGLTVQEAAEFRAVLAVVGRQAQVLSDLPAGPDTDDVGKTVKNIDIIAVVIFREPRLFVLPERMEIPSLEAEIRAELFLDLDESRPIERGNDVAPEDRPFRKDRPTDGFSKAARGCLLAESALRTRSSKAFRYSDSNLGIFSP